MRKLSDRDTAMEMAAKKRHEEINQELIELGTRIDENAKAIDQTNERIDAMEAADTIEKANGHFDNLRSDTLQVNGGADIDSIESRDILTGNLGATDIQTATLNAINADINKASVGELRADELTAPTIYSGVVEADFLNASDINAETGSFKRLDLNTAVIENFDVAHVVAEDVSTTEITTEIITGQRAQLSDIAAEIIRADIAALHDIQTHNLSYADDPDNPYYIHIEPQDQPSATDYRILEVPFIDTGDYMLSLHDPATDMAWWSVIVRNNQSNLTVAYSRRTSDMDGKPLTNPTLSQFYVYDFDGQSPRLYIKTYVGGNLYWQNQSLRNRPEITMFNEYPFDISSAKAVKYDVLHIAATWFTHHVDIGANQSLGNASLFLIPSDWNNATKEMLEYNTERDIPYRYYLPDQSLDTTDEVAFANLVIEPLDGRWVYNVNNALKGHDPVRIKAGYYGTQTYDTNGRPEPVIGDKEAGQLNAYPWVIETDDLARWSGKVGTQTSADTTIPGTIYRDDAYTKISDRLYRRTDFADYDRVDYASSSTATNVLVLQRKHDSDRGQRYDLCVSDPYVKSEYEDPDLQIWEQYTYTWLGEYPSGSMYTKWISRIMPSGERVSRILETTVDSDEYITKVVEFDEPFESGDIVLHKASNDGYHKPLIYVGDVVEGRWKAGELHSMRKNVDPLSDDYTGTDYDYTGALTADGETRLRDSVHIIDDYDASDVKPVELIETTAKETNLVSTEEMNIQSLEDLTLNAATIHEEYSESHTSRGPSEIAYHEKDDYPTKDADFNHHIIENTEIGSSTEKRDLKVNGKIYADEVVASNVGDLNVEDNRLLYYQDSNFQPLSYSFAGDKARYPMKSVPDGSLVYMPDWDGVSPLVDIADFLKPFNPSARDATLGVPFSDYASDLVFDIQEGSTAITVSGTVRFYDHGVAWTSGYFLPVQISDKWRYAAVRGGASIADDEARIIDVRLDDVIVRKLASDLSNDLLIKLYEELPEGLKTGDTVKWTDAPGSAFSFDTSALVKE